MECLRCHNDVTVPHGLCYCPKEKSEATPVERLVSRCADCKHWKRCGMKDTGWVGIVASGMTVGNYHSWSTDGIYQVRTKARDTPYLAESEWSESLIVVIGGIQSPYADYGDAPDDSQNSSVTGKFPSLYDSINVRIPGRRGPYHLTTDQEWLGGIASVTTKEHDALIVDNDIDDCDPLIYIYTEDPAPDTQSWALIAFDMTIAQNAPTDIYHYVNVLFDQNQDGEWKNTDPMHLEWIVVNRPIRISESYRGIKFKCMLGPFYVKLPRPEPAWIRITLTREPIKMDEWDGSGPSDGFDYGETEDWLIEWDRYADFTNVTKNLTAAWFAMSQRIRGNSGCGIHATDSRGPSLDGRLTFSYFNSGTEDLTINGFDIHDCDCGKVAWTAPNVRARINGIWNPIPVDERFWGALLPIPPILRTNDIIEITVPVGWIKLPVKPFCGECRCGDGVHKLYVDPLVDPVQNYSYIAFWPGNITVLDPVEYYIPLPYSFWNISEYGLTNIIKYDGTESIVITPSYVTQTEYMGSCHMTWEETQHLDWIPLDETILSSGDTIEFSPPMKSGDIAAFIKYEVRYELPDSCSQNNYIDRFISEAILSNPWPTNPDLLYTITNFEVQNSLDIPVDTYELEFHGDINPSDIVDWHDPEPPGEPYLSEGTWYDGWGCPPSINTIPNGIKVTWIDTNTPIQPGQSVYFGLFVNPEVSIPAEIKGHWNIFTYAPDKPSIDGPSSGKVGVEYTYTSVTTDPDGNKVLYWFDWGDGSNSGWLGPYNSGEIASAFHTWTEKDDYEIKVKAKDIYDAEGPWSDPLPITMPKNKPYLNTPFLNFLANHPHMFPLLRHLFGL